MSATGLRELSIGEVLDIAIKIYWRNASTLLRLVVFVVAPAQFLVSLLFVSALPDYDESVFTEPSPSPTTEYTAEDFWIAGTATLLGVVITFLATTLATAACFKAVADAYLGEPSHWRSSVQFALRRVHSVIWVTFLGAFLAVLGLLFLIVPGVWLWVSFAVAVPVLLTEGIKGRRALGRSRRLVKGRWWPTFGIMLLGTVLAGIATVIVSALLEAVRLTDISESSLAVIILDAIGATVATTITTPFTAAFVTVLYFDLRVRKEAFDLQLLAERIGVEPRPEWERAPLPASPLAPAGHGGAQPPYWPPPPGWKPEPAQAPETPAQPEEPPYWPPPPGWKPGGAGE